MKNLNLFLSVLFALVAMSSCGPESVKGKWTDADKAVFKSEFEKTLKQDNNLDDSTVAKISDCALSKLESEFSVDDADKKENEAKLEALVTACVTENIPAIDASTSDTTNTAAPAIDTIK